MPFYVNYILAPSESRKLGFIRKKVTREYASEKEREAAAQIAEENRNVHQLYLDRGKKVLKSLSLSHWDSFLVECEIFPRNISFFRYLGLRLYTFFILGYQSW